MQKLFGGIRFKWRAVIIASVLAAVITALAAVFVPDGNSFHEIAVHLEAWILFAVLIIVNCEKPGEAALKTFVFFLISQPLIYLFQVPFSWQGWGLFRYYGYWFVLTVLTFPGAYLGWFIKKDKWYSGLILSVVLCFLAWQGTVYARDMIRNFPNHLVSTLFCFGQIPLYLFLILKDKKARWLAAAVTALALAAALLFPLFTPKMDIASGLDIDDARYPVNEHWTVSVEDERVSTAALVEMSEGDYFLSMRFYDTKENTVTLRDENGKEYPLVIRYVENSGPQIVSEPGTEVEAAAEQEEARTEKESEKGHFAFQPKVSSVYLDEIFGEEMVQTWYNLVDAVLAGEDTFACPDQWTYDWVVYQFPDRCFPVLNELIEPSFEPVEDGVAHIVYKTSREEFETKMTEFETLVTDILNETMRDDYTDLEKALSLYRYFAHHYVYDYDTYDRMYTESPPPVLTSYSLLTEGTGVCQEISAAYSYLLLQADVDATIMMGEDHQWSYVRINGKNYHIDPTFALGANDSLEYFMMTDEKRAQDGFPSEHYVIASAFTQEYGAPDYKADDETFAPVWYTYLDSFDHDTHTLRVYVYDEADEPVYSAFDYGGF